MGKAGDLGLHGYDNSAVNSYALPAKEGQILQIPITIPVREILSRTLLWATLLNPEFKKSGNALLDEKDFY